MTGFGIGLILAAAFALAVLETHEFLNTRARRKQRERHDADKRTWLAMIDEADAREAARIASARKTKSVTPAACIPPNRGHDAGREE